LDSDTGHADILSREQSNHIISNLHAILKPFLLRRLKKDVETNLPPKKEYLLSAPLTAQQKDLYDAVVNKTIRSFLMDKKMAGDEDDYDDLPHLLQKTKVQVGKNIERGKRHPHMSRERPTSF